MTPRQYGMIKGRADELGMTTDEEISVHLPEGKTLKNMTRSEASGFIDYLGQLLDAGADQDDD